MKLRWQGFQGPIATPIERYLTHKRALGCRFHTEERALRLLDRFLMEREIRTLDEIQPGLLESFLASRPRSRPRSYNHLLCVVRRLFDWLVAQGELMRSPVQTVPRRETARRIPFLFNAEQARRLLDAAINLPDNSKAPLRGHTYRTIFALLYGLVYGSGTFPDCAAET
jgi:site-specific recombinase XerD